MGNGNLNSGGGEPATPLACDVGLGLNSEPPYPCKKTTYMSLSSLYHLQASEIGSESGGVYGNRNLFASENTFKSISDGVMGASGKMLFTATQWQELQRQTMIFKYIIASIPVPPQLLLPLSTQSNRMSMGLRFSNGSDPEPWRCRRTDGKKWRCSRDVAPDQKYCERHSHKTRSRSRKPVEIQPHNTKHSYHPLLPSTDTKIESNNPNMLSIINSSKEQTRSSDWFMKSGVMDVTQSTNQFQMSSPSVGSKRDEIYRHDTKGNYGHKSFLDHSNPYLNTTGISSTANDAAAGERRQHFIDAWSRIGNGDDCSLSLSVQSGGSGIEYDDHESFQMAVGMLDGDRGCGDGSKSQNQWLTHGSWEGSTLGGPLGEALCLGIDKPAYIPPNGSPSFH